MTGQASTFAFVGSSTAGKGAGITAFRYDEATSRLEPALVIGDLANPTFVELDETRGLLYAVQELDSFEGAAGGGLAVFSLVFSADAGLRAQRLATRATVGASPCHVRLDAKRRVLFVSNYGDGILSWYPLDTAGIPAEAPAVIRYLGRGSDPLRQECAHVHSVVIDPDNRHLLVADLGRDLVLTYRLDAESGLPLPGSERSTGLRPGSGPRHFAFGPDGTCLYVVEELSNEITVFAWERENGALREIQTVSMLPRGFRGSSTAADIHILPGRNLLYASNRGHDSIVRLEIDPPSGRLSNPVHVSSGGAHPRNFAIDPSGNYLLVADAWSDRIEHFHIEPATGLLSPAGISTPVGEPMCIRFGNLRPASYR